MLEYYLKTEGPKIHIQICEMISIMGLEIIEDGFGTPNSDDFYGFFKIKSDPASLDMLSSFSGVTVILPPEKIVR